MKKSMLSSLAGLALGLVGAAPAYAQPDPPPPPPPGVAASSAGYYNGGAGIGVGIMQQVGGFPAGAGFPVGQFVYDQAIFHVEGFFGFDSANTGPAGRTTDFIFGAGGWYHISRGSASDFSLGASLGVETVSGAGASATITAFQPGAQIRAFLTPNVALHARGGIAMLFGDAPGATRLEFGGQLVGAFGITYFFR
jgi:hypothetical protein